MAILPRTVGEQLLYSTVRISGSSGIGTGFFFNFKVSEEKRVDLILTNKHVVEKNDGLKFRFHEAVNQDNKFYPSDNSFDLGINGLEKIWIPHPSDNVDLGAFYMEPLKKHSKETLKKDIFAIFFDESIIKDDSFLENASDVTDEVFMVGYPTGLWDEVNNLPIIRKGIAASHPALDFNGLSKGVVDIACFPGSSGSPILLYSQNYTDKSGNTYMGGSKAILLGLLSSGPVFTNEGLITIEEIPTNYSPKISTTHMMHLGYYEKSKEILSLIEIIRSSVQI